MKSLYFQNTREAYKENRKGFNLNLTLEGRVTHDSSIFPHFIHCYGLVCPQSPYVEALTPIPQNVTVLETGPLKGWSS